jgi:hypothetical protein
MSAAVVTSRLRLRLRRPRPRLLFARDSGVALATDASSAAAAVEVLARLRDAARGLVSPAAVLEAALVLRIAWYTSLCAWGRTASELRRKQRNTGRRGSVRMLEVICGKV